MVSVNPTQSYYQTRSNTHDWFVNALGSGLMENVFFQPVFYISAPSEERVFGHDVHLCFRSLFYDECFFSRKLYNAMQIFYVVRIVSLPYCVLDYDLFSRYRLGILSISGDYLMTNKRYWEREILLLSKFLRNDAFELTYLRYLSLFKKSCTTSLWGVCALKRFVRYIMGNLIRERWCSRIIRVGPYLTPTPRKS